MAKKSLLKERGTNEDLYPVTSLDCVIGSDKLNDRLKAVEDKLELEDEKPVNDYVQFVIDQSYTDNLSDPDGMVYSNVVYPNNTVESPIEISSSGSTGKPEYNCLTWLRANTHAYVGRFVDGVMRLKQLDDSTRKKFADKTSAIDYIGNESGEYDVWVKINSDVYYKTEPWKAPSDTATNEDKILVTIARKLPIGEDESKWQKWSKNRLVGVYEACRINNKLHSLSGKRPINNISQTTAKSQSRARGEGFRLVTYDFCKLLAFLFYGYYSTLNSQEQCGYGTISIANNIYYPKITGATDDFGNTDTIKETGSSANTPLEDAIIAGEGANIVSNCFWNVENFQGDIYEWLDDMRVMQAKRPASVTNPNPKIYISDYIVDKDFITVTKSGTDYVLTKELLEAMDENQRFISITDINDNIVRIIQHGDHVANSEGYIKKMCFGEHADIIAKQFGGNANVGFCDYGGVNSVGAVAVRSHLSASSYGGVGFLHLVNSAGVAHSYIGSRLQYDGTDKTIHIIDDATEHL